MSPLGPGNSGASSFSGISRSQAPKTVTDDRVTGVLRFLRPFPVQVTFAPARSSGWEASQRGDLQHPKTVRRYVEAAVVAGVSRDGGVEQLTDVVSARLCWCPSGASGWGRRFQELGVDAFRRMSLRRQCSQILRLVVSSVVARRGGRCARSARSPHRDAQSSAGYPRLSPSIWVGSRSGPFVTDGVVIDCRMCRSSNKSFPIRPSNVRPQRWQRHTPRVLSACRHHNW